MSFDDLTIGENELKLLECIVRAGVYGPTNKDEDSIVSALENEGFVCQADGSEYVATRRGRDYAHYRKRDKQNLERSLHRGGYGL